MAEVAAYALRQRKAAQAADRLKAGEVWQDGRVFTTTIGTMFSTSSIRRGFRHTTGLRAWVMNWVPRELRHTFVSIMSAGGVPVEEIARLAGHQQTSTTELVVEDGGDVGGDPARLRAAMAVRMTSRVELGELRRRAGCGQEPTWAWVESSPRAPGRQRGRDELAVMVVAGVAGLGGPEGVQDG